MRQAQAESLNFKTNLTIGDKCSGVKHHTVVPEKISFCALSLTVILQKSKHIYPYFLDQIQ